MLRLMLLALGCTVVLGGCSYTQLQPGATARDIGWSADRPLRWDDFQGVVDPNAPSTTVAITAASLRWGYKYRIERDENECAYRLTDIHSEAVFSQRDSWVRPGYRNSAVLNHEQGHFDLTQIFKRMFDQRAAGLINTRNACEGSTMQAASRDAERDAATLVEAVFDSIWQALIATQAAYDEQAQHGIATEAQGFWTERIQRGLRARQWEASTSARR